jgi:hypothetical protein
MTYKPTEQEQRHAAEFLLRCLSHVGWDSESCFRILKGPAHFYHWLRNRPIDPGPEFRDGIKAYFERNNYAPCQGGEIFGQGPRNLHVEDGYRARLEQAEPMIHPAFTKGW